MQIEASQLFYALKRHDSRYSFNFTRKQLLVVVDACFYFSDSLQATVIMPINVVGDVHGDFPALYAVVKAYEDYNFLLLGDIWDRGFYYLECAVFCILGVFLYKFWMIRGNHDGVDFGHASSFKNTLERLGFSDFFPYFYQVFSKLPVSAIDLSQKFFAVHGAPNIAKNIFMQPDVLEIYDMLWSDIEENCTTRDNERRSAGKIYSANDVIYWMNANGIEVLFKGHQPYESGYGILYNRIFIMDNYSHGIAVANVSMSKGSFYIEIYLFTRLTVKSDCV